MAGYIKVVLRDKSNKEVAGGKILVDEDQDQGVTTNTIELTLGDHAIQVLYGEKPTDPPSKTVTVETCDPGEAPEVTFKVVG